MVLAEGEGGRRPDVVQACNYDFFSVRGSCSLGDLAPRGKHARQKTSRHIITLLRFMDGHVVLWIYSEASICVYMCEYRDRATVGVLVGTFSITLTVGPLLFVSPSVFMFSAIIGISVYVCILMCAYI